MVEENQINRRKFLTKAGGIITAGLVIPNSFCSWSQDIKYNYETNKILEERLKRIEDELKKEKIIRENRKKIFNELSKHVHITKFRFEGVFEGEEKIRKYTQKGCGIILKGKYISVAHNFEVEDEIKRGGIFGNLKFPFEVKKKKITLYGEELKELFCDYKNDVIIFELSTHLKNYLKEFPCKPNTKYSLGDTVYMIGNPRLWGKNIREEIISTLESCDYVEKYLKTGKKDSFFGYSGAVSKGESGSPIVNENYELLGLASHTLEGNFGYAKKIEEFLKELKKFEWKK